MTARPIYATDRNHCFDRAPSMPCYLMDLCDGRDRVTIIDLIASGDTETLAAVVPLAVGDSVTVGGGAAVQFTITRTE
jgi:hypothetical protein